MTYSRASPELIIIDHTGVPDALSGKGVGQELAKHAVEEAARRLEGHSALPVSSRHRSERHPEWQDNRPITDSFGRPADKKVNKKIIKKTEMGRETSIGESRRIFSP